MARRTAVQTQQDVTVILREDHDRARKLFKQIQNTSSPGKRQDLLYKLTEELRTHTTLEEELVYPEFQKAIRNEKGQELYQEAIDEHSEVDELIDSLLEADAEDEDFLDRVRELEEMVEHHATEEETEMFPMMQKNISPEKLAELGDKVQSRRAELTA